MNFGYSFWGFLADKKVENGKVVSTPDGNAAYSWSILYEAQRRGWQPYLMQKDRDAEFYRTNRCNSFKSFSMDSREKAYRRSFKTITSYDLVLNPLEDLPSLDVLLLEWRFPIPGRNCEIETTDPNYQSDLDRQIELLEFYKDKDTKIIIWDLDHKLTLEDEVKWKPDAIFETSVEPRDFGLKRTRVEPPILINELMQFDTLPVNESRKAVYIGSRYERDDVIEEWIKPISDFYPFEIEFWGNWTREPNLSECREKWPNILYNKRITMIDFREVYGTAVSCPILGKKSYFESGFITPRPWEALLFGTIPVGLSCHKGISQYTNFVADSPLHMVEIIDELASMSLEQRDTVRREAIEKIEFMDASNFLNRIEDVLNG